MPEDANSFAPGRLEAVLAEIIQAEEKGQVIDEERYLDSFPQFAGPLREYFHNRKHFAGLMGGAVAASPPIRLGLEVGGEWPGYEILEELGRGGMGIVYRARQLRPQRQVALKVIRMDRLEALPAGQRQQWLDRFQREAQLVAALDRPDDIVSLYEVGEHEGLSYFTMRLVAGGTLAARLKQLKEGDAAQAREQRLRGQRDSARLLARVARAVHYAHERGVLHRDLKPANILLDERGRPLVSDFGLARRVDQTGSLVAAGIEGTAEYMSPEQARATPGAATTAADVYSLGAILYECLTGQPPFQGKSPVETLVKILNEKLIPPRRLEPRLDRDLETICLKCLEEEPGRRYSSAAALADDLDAWLEGRLIGARPVGTAERLWRWCRRNPVLAASLGIAAAALVAFTVVAGVFAYFRDKANRRLEQSASALSAALGEAKDQRNQAVAANEELRREQRASRQRTAGLALDRGRAAWEAGDPAQGHLWMAWSLTQAPEDDPALQEAIRINLAGWGETLLPPRPPLPHPGLVAQAGFTTDGTRLVALSTGTVRSEEKVMPDGKKGRFLVFRPDLPGEDPFSGAGFRLEPTFGEQVPGLVPPPAADFGPIPPLANRFSPDLRSLSTARGRVLVWDVATGKPVDVKPPPENSNILAVTPDGRIALAAKHRDQVSWADTVQLWDLADGKPVGEEVKLNSSLRWSACGGGKTFVSLGDGFVLLWDTETAGRTSFSLRGHGPHRAALSPDGRVLALVSASGEGPVQAGRPPFLPMAGTAPGGEIELYDLVTKKRLPPGAWSDHPLDPSAGFAVGPGGRLVLTASPPDVLTSGAIRLWDRQAKGHVRLPSLQGRLAFAQFSPDGKVLLTASRLGLTGLEGVQLWDTKTGLPHGAPLLPRGPVQTAAFTPNGKLLAIACGKGEVQLWETATGRPVARALRHPGPVYAVAFSSDGSKLVTAGHDGMARIFDTHSNRAVQPVRSLERVALLAPDGSRTLQRLEGNRLRLHDTASGRPCGEPVPCGEKDRVLALGPDRRTLVLAGARNIARLWDGVTGKPIGEPLEHVGPVASARFSPDGRTLLTFVASTSPLTQQPIVYRWDPATGHSLGFEKNEHVRMARAISPDGRWALRVLGTSNALVWDLDTVRQSPNPPRPLEQGGPVTGGLFSPDSGTLLTVAARSGSWEEARLWDPATGKPLGPPMPHQGPIRALAFSPDGKRVLTGSDDGTARLWDAATGRRLGPPLAHGDRIRAVAFGPDGKLAATAADDGTVRLWHLATGQSLGPPLPHPAAVSFVTFDAKGETLIAAADDHVRVWKIPGATAGEAKHLLLEAEVETGMVLDGGTPRLLEDGERDRRRQQLEEAKKAHDG